MRRTGVALAAVTLATVALTAVVASPSPAATVPSGFTDSAVATVARPTAIEFTPDGRMLVITQDGKLFVGQNGALPATPALDLGAELCSANERGLLGLAVDPAFTANRYVYLYFTKKNAAGQCPTTHPSPTNNVARFVLGTNNVVDPATRQMVFEGILSFAGNHNAGDLMFGPDGKLYVAVGDGGCDPEGDSGCAGLNDVSRDKHIAMGKILRLNPDGSAPSDNPYFGQTSDLCDGDGRTEVGKHCPETFAWGFRNPFRMAFSPTGQLHVNDVGQAAWEEIDVIVAGADYGWNVREGHCANNSTTNCGPPPSGLTNPIHDYSHAATGCRSITGGAFVPPNSSWPAAYRGDYLFADYICGKIFRLEPGSPPTRVDFVTDLGLRSAVHLEWGPDDALYYTTYFGGGEIRKITFGTPPPSSTAPTTTTPPTTTPPTSTTFLSALNATKTGTGRFELDKNANKSQIKLDGHAYAKGIGMYPTVTLTYALGGRYTRFLSDIGIDDICGGSGSVVFRVFMNGASTPSYDSSRMTGATPRKQVNLDVTGKSSLAIQLSRSGSTVTCDYGDWADARLLSTTSTTTTAPTTTAPTTTTPPTTAPPGATTFVSDLQWVSATNGFGPVERDQSVGNRNAGDGTPIRLGTKTYAKGLGVHPRSEITFNLNRAYARFLTDAGIDEVCGGAGGVVFEVYRDGVRAYTSGKVTGQTATKVISLDTSTTNTLRLVVLDSGDGLNCDHADWANARLTR